MSANSGFHNIPLLKGRENYETWKFAAQAILDVEGLWDIVSGTESEHNPEKVAILNRKAKTRLILMIETIIKLLLQVCGTN